MSRAKRKDRREEIYLKAVSDNIHAIHDGPIKKKWTKHDIHPINPITDSQQLMFQLYFQGDHIVAHGYPGTGKTLVALYLAICDVIDPTKPQNKLIIVRSTVASRDQGFLPGDLNEKQAVFESPYHDIFEYIFGRKSTYADMKKAGLIEFMSTSYVRGLTWDNCIVFLDEMQNCNWQEANSVASRVGENSRIIFAGDITQNDLIKNNRDVTGVSRILQTAERMSETSIVEFGVNDIVRSGFVRSWIIASED